MFCQQSYDKDNMEHSRRKRNIHFTNFSVTKENNKHDNLKGKTYQFVVYQGCWKPCL